ncbi:MAG TPA: AraC family transcriptional regulator [Polyangiaceae bacterium]|nr:AraC family transcriptional regulator [Polyangiaceae bacterium]
MSTDTLSEVLRAVRLNGAVFFAIDASTPWVAEAPPAREIGHHLLPGAEHVIEYHVLTHGSCWAGIVGEPPVRLETGDVIAFPQGDSHVLSSEPGARGAVEGQAYRAPSESRRLPVRVDMGGNGSDPARIICGFLGCDARPFNPLLATLPRTLHVRSSGPSDPLGKLIELALSESEAPRAGGECILSRLSELLFVELVRRYLAALPPENVSWLAGLRDESIGRVLAELHNRPTHDWSLDELGREVGMSRSALAERFTHFVGVPPMQYLAQWRMQLASSLLSGTTLSLAEIAARVGYGSETALSRAYKRWVGVSPGEWRRERRTG